MALLDVAGLCAGYGDVPVLRGIDLSIPAGSITALIGANGAGKTTLLRTISGIIPTEAGTIRYDGRDIVGMPPQDIVRAGLVQVPEGRRLFSEMTVFENLLVGSSSPAARRSRDENLAMVLELFPRVRERRAQRAGTLSGGEQHILGPVPLVVATGAAELSRRAVGTAVFGGMLAASSIGIFMVPLLDVTFQWLRERVKADLQASSRGRWGAH